MRRRELIKLLGMAATFAWPSTARSQQGGIRLIGVLHSTTFGDDQLHALQTGLRELGYVQDRDYALLVRAAENKVDQLPSFAADLIGAKVSVIMALGGPAPARTAKAATSEIPIVFAYGGDPVRDGLVTSLSRPGGNATGITFISTTVSAKRLEILRQLVPGMRKVAMLVNPKSALAELEIKDIEAAARLFGLQLQVVNASSSAELDAAFATIAQISSEGLLLGTDPGFGLSYRDQIISLGARYKIPAISPNRLVPIAGGLISYGASLLDAWRQSGAYVGRIFKGEKPADLPVMQPTKLEMVINLKTAKAIGIQVPAELIARADEIVE
jgi:putative tryptophan/tyrosine transport system substrate-binding protein